jgi:O-antigen/teichoic acid export membrane protein
VKLLPQLRTDFFFSTSLNIFLIRFFPALANTVIMILFSRELSQSAYGVYQHFWVQALTLSTVACAGIQALIITYPREMVLGSMQGLGLKHYLVFGGWLLLWSGVFAWLQYRYGGFLPVLPLAFLFVYTISVVLESFLLSFRRFKELIWINVAYSVLFSLLHVALLQKIFRLSDLFLTLMVLILIKGLYCAWLLIPEFRKAVVYEKRKLKLLKHMWLHLGVYDVIQVIFRWADKFIMGLFLTQAMFGVYFNGSVDIPFLPLLLGAAGSAVLMQLARQEMQHAGTAVAVMLHSSRLLSCVVFPVFFLLVLFRYELFDVLFTSRYREAVPIFLAASLVIPLRAYNFTTILQNRNKGGIINAGAAGDLLLALGLMYPFYSWLGLPGVALSFVISTWLQATFYLVMTSRLLKVRIYRLLPWKNWLWKILVFSISIAAVHHLLGDRLSTLWVLIAGIVVTMVLILVSLRMEMSSEHTGELPERKMADSSRN